jgi:hypothetical protein
MKKIHEHKPCKFTIVCGEKVYKFALDNEEDKKKWVEAINKEISNKGITKKKIIENILEVPLKKKIIIDYYNLPNISNEKMSIKKRIEEEILTENYFERKKEA